MRTILHSDCNSFYASVEAAEDPALRGLPVAVCGDPALRHGIILAKSTLAKKCGVLTGEAIWQAKQKCPTLVLVPADQRKYLLYSRKMRAIYRRYTHFVEPFGLDESWLDVTGHSLTGEEIAAQIRNSAKEELGITVSVGVSFNKVFAKLGSDMRKPDATTVITVENFKDKVWPLPAEELLYVGRATKRRLARLALYTIGDLACADDALIRAVLGKNGEMLQRFARGQDEAPVLCAEEAEEIKSIGNSTTTPHDIRDEAGAKAVLYLLSDSVAARLRAHRLACRTVSVWMRDSELNGQERQCRLGQISDSGSDIARAALSLLREHYHWHLPLRSLGVCGSDLKSTEHMVQLPLWTPPKVLRERALEGALDDIRSRWGHNAIRRGLMLCGAATQDLNPVDDHDLQALSAMRGRG
ncbi:MAG: DNA polymerase IV [Clostridiales bacterium]|nr:DNA polymerase IV [Clostridiales bacterium]